MALNDKVRADLHQSGLLVMQKISLSYVFELANQIEIMAQLAKPDSNNAVVLDDIFFKLMFCQGSLERLLDESAFSPFMRICEPLGRRLLESIRELTKLSDLKQSIPIWQVDYIESNYASFKVALLAEFESFNTYITTNKGAYDMFSLLSRGEVVFPTDMASKVPEALADARQASRALAFELPTSCGFHIFRATECILRRYYSHVTNGKAHPKVRNLGVYINALRQSKSGDERILSALKQMTDLHRNPLVHPEVILSTEEAISVLGMAHSVMTAMLRDLPIAPQTTTTAITA